MKAITIWQPWASLLACGAKKYETRSWATNYRGPIAIHAGANPSHELDWKTRDAIKKAFNWPDKMDSAPHIREMPHGAVIATAELVECHEIRACTSTYGPGYGYVSIPRIIIYPNGNEFLFGNWTPGRYAWEFANMKLLDEPIPTNGKQGLWNWEGGERDER